MTLLDPGKSVSTTWLIFNWFGDHLPMWPATTAEYKLPNKAKGQCEENGSPV